MVWRSLDYRLLMEESEHRIELACKSGSEAERTLARRILDSEKQHRSWEASHFRLMKSVAAIRSTEGQLRKLRELASSLTHAQALFRYLKDNEVTGTRRRALFSVFYGPADYVNAVITEHGRFLKAASSGLCTSYIGLKIWRDPVFDDPLTRYEDAYFSYFSVYCDCAIAEAEHRDSSTRSLLLLLKKEAMRRRAELLSGPCDLEPAAQVRRLRREHRFGVAGIRSADTYL